MVGVSNFVGSWRRLGSAELYSPDNRSITNAENVLTSPNHSPVTLCAAVQTSLQTNVLHLIHEWRICINYL